MNTSNKFNISAEKSLENKLNGYNLTPEERAKVWEIAKSREENIKKENENFNNPQVFEQRLKETRDRLKAQEKPQPQYNYSKNPQETDFQFKVKVRNEVQQNHSALKKDYQQNANKNIDAVLNKAYEQNRGPKTQTNQQNQSLSQEFNQNAQRDR